MSTEATRAEFAAALSTVTGITGYARRPRPVRPGDAWPQWGGGARSDATMGFEETWRVMVVTDQGTADDADRFLDQHGTALLDALTGVMFVDSYAPAELVTETGPLYALMITGRSE